MAQKYVLLFRSYSTFSLNVQLNKRLLKLMTKTMTKCPLRDTSYYHLLLPGQYKRVERAFLFMHFYCWLTVTPKETFT